MKRSTTGNNYHVEKNSKSRISNVHNLTIQTENLNTMSNKKRSKWSEERDDYDSDSLLEENGQLYTCGYVRNTILYKRLRIIFLPSLFLFVLFCLYLFEYGNDIQEDILILQNYHLHVKENPLNNNNPRTESLILSDSEAKSTSDIGLLRDRRRYMRDLDIQLDAVGQDRKEMEKEKEMKKDKEKGTNNLEQPIKEIKEKDETSKQSNNFVKENRLQGTNKHPRFTDGNELTSIKTNVNRSATIDSTYHNDEAKQVLLNDNSKQENKLQSTQEENISITRDPPIPTVSRSTKLSGHLVAKLWIWLDADDQNSFHYDDDYKVKKVPHPLNKKSHSHKQDKRNRITKWESKINYNNPIPKKFSKEATFIPSNNVRPHATDNSQTSQGQRNVIPNLAFLPPSQSSNPMQIWKKEMQQHFNMANKGHVEKIPDEIYATLDSSLQIIKNVEGEKGKELRSRVQSGLIFPHRNIKNHGNLFKKSSTNSADQNEQKQKDFAYVSFPSSLHSNQPVQLADGMTIFVALRPTWLSKKGNVVPGQRFFGHYPYGQFRFIEESLSFKTYSGDYLLPLKENMNRSQATISTKTNVKEGINAEQFLLAGFRFDRKVEMSVNGLPFRIITSDTGKNDESPIFSNNGFLTIGGTNGLYEFMGDIGEILIFDSPLTDQESKAVYEYLGHKFNIELLNDDIKTHQLTNSSEPEKLSSKELSQNRIKEKEQSNDPTLSKDSTSTLSHRISSTSFRGSQYSHSGLKKTESKSTKNSNSNTLSEDPDSSSRFKTFSFQSISITSQKDCLEENILEFQSPVDNYIPPINASEDEKLFWKKEVSKMKNKLRGFMKGGKELKHFMKSEVQNLKNVRNELFCKYYKSKET